MKIQSTRMCPLQLPAPPVVDLFLCRSGRGSKDCLQLLQTCALVIKPSTDKVFSVEIEFRRPCLRTLAVSIGDWFPTECLPQERHRDSEVKGENNLYI